MNPSKYTELLLQIANRLIECGVPDPKGLPRVVREELARAIDLLPSGLLLRIDRGESPAGIFLRVETRLGNESNLFYINI